MSAVIATDQNAIRLPAQPVRECVCDEAMSQEAALAHCNDKFANLAPQERIEWSLENLPGNHVLSSSFGAQAAVSLHLATQVLPDIPVVLVDTGYLFPETYQFVEELTTQLKLQPEGLSQPDVAGMAGSTLRPALAAGCRRDRRLQRR